MKSAFTMVELVFIVVIIGILTTVALPKFTVSRNEAASTICIHEISQLVLELSGNYTKYGYVTFKTKQLSYLTNVKLGVSQKSGLSNQPTETMTDGKELIYLCDGSEVVTMTWNAKKSDLTIASKAISFNVEDEALTITDIVKQRLAGGLLSVNGDSRVYDF